MVIMGLIRLLLALSVVLAHSGPFVLTGNRFVGGLVAVEAFFIISGFYMALVMESKYADNTLVFYRNRFLRIFPTYWAILLVAVAAGFLFGENRFDQLLKADFSAGTLAPILSSNLLIFGSDAMMFLSSAGDGLYFTSNFYHESVKLYEYHYIPQSWTLPIELMFYLTVPFFFRKFNVIIALLLVSFVIKIVTMQSFGWTDPWNYRFFPSEFMMFCLGMLSYRLYCFWQGRGFPRFVGEVSLVVIVLFTVMFESVPVSLRLKMLLYFTLLILLIPFVFERFRNNYLDRMVGETSYPVYLCHLIVIGAVNYYGISFLGDKSIIYLLGSMIFALLVHLYISEPIEQRFKVKMRKS